MPLVLLVIILAGFGIGTSFISDYEASHQVRTLSCEEFYKQPVRDGYVKLTDCTILCYDSYFYGNKKTNLATEGYSPVIPAGYDGKIRILMREDSAETMRIQQLLNPVKAMDGEAARAYFASHKAELLHQGTVEGKVISSGEKMSSLRTIADDPTHNVSSDFVIVDPLQSASERGDTDWNIGLFFCAIGGIGTAFAMSAIVIPYATKDARKTKDKNGFVGLAGRSGEEIKAELDRGAKFVVYTYSVSILVLTFKRPSPIFFITRDDNRYTKGLVYAFVSLIAGWWGFPWGPIYTFQSLFTCLTGGKDVTQDVLQTANALNPPATEKSGPATQPV